jgi:hypothetical protein
MLNLCRLFESMFYISGESLDLYFLNVRDRLYVATVWFYVTHEMVGDAIMVRLCCGFIHMLYFRIDFSNVPCLPEECLGLCATVHICLSDLW